MDILVASSQQTTPRSVVPIERGQLYNLDRNEKFQFQFNPLFGPVHPLNWTDSPLVRTATTARQFLQSGQISFQLNLRYLVDPSAPPVRHSTTPKIAEPNDKGLLNLEALIEVMEKWVAIIPELRRPSLIQVIMFDRYWTGIIEEWEPYVNRYFPDGRIRDLNLRLEFSQWRTNTRSR